MKGRVSIEVYIKQFKGQNTASQVTLLLFCVLTNKTYNMTQKFVLRLNIFNFFFSKPILQYLK